MIGGAYIRNVRIRMDSVKHRNLPEAAPESWDAFDNTTAGWLTQSMKPILQLESAHGPI
jgi:hypothetical protein